MCWIEIFFLDSDQQNNGKITIHPNLRDLLKAKGIKNRFNHKHQNKLLTPTRKEEANQLFKKPDITIRTGDKTNIYIIFKKKKTDYNNNNKIENILSNQTKLKKKKLTKTPTDQLKNTFTKLS